MFSLCRVPMPLYGYTGTGEIECVTKCIASSTHPWNLIVGNKLEYQIIAQYIWTVIDSLTSRSVKKRFKRVKSGRLDLFMHVKVYK